MAIAKVLKAQTKLVNTQNVLTFNYDDLLEKAFDVLNVDYKATYKSDRVLGTKNIVNIIHSHGLLSTKNIDDKNYNSIVLTTMDYFNNYRYTSSYGYSQLYSHLDKTCYFIGNSITDYEEQKVISTHFKKNNSSFHYAFDSIEGKSIKTIMYKTIFLLRIGIIPLWYSSHAKYASELESYANGI